jgi:3',5'-cyclic AMP phosphodiesterase CpdA
MVDNREGSRLIFKYAIMADTHIRTPDESSSPWKTNLLTNDRARWVAQAINTHSPDLVIHLGDIVHPVPHLPSHKPASDTAREIMGNLKSPYYLVPGNHDVGDKNNPTVPSHIINDDYLENFHRCYGSTYRSFDHRGIHFVIMNSSAFNSGLQEETLQKEWLENDLDNHKADRVHIFSHYPPYLHLPNEPSNYDNLDPPGRKWLLSLIEEHRVETLFAGHVHQFFYKRHSETDIYNLLSTCNLRQDYSNMFRVEPVEEYGRNDAAKLGYCIVNVYPNNCVAHIHRSYGQTLKEGETLREEEKIEAIYPSEYPLSPLGVQLRYPLAEITELPNVGPLDEFVRKRARDDYTVLALWETGIMNIRLPLADLTDEVTRQRLQELHRMGIRCGFFAVNPPAPDLIAEHRHLMDFLEIVIPWETAREILPAATKLRESLNIPVYLANIESSIHRTQTGQTFSHYISSGFHIGDASKLEVVLSLRGAFDGFAFEVGQYESPLPTIKRISDYALEHGFKALINIRLAPENPAEYLQDDNHTANRVAEAAIAGYSYPKVRILIDTFMDHDRGYFPRVGLYDRRLNPRRAAFVLRHLNSAINRYGTEITEPSMKTSQDWTTITFHSPQTVYTLKLPQTSDALATPSEIDTIDLITGTINPSKVGDGVQLLTVQTREPGGT